MYEIWHADKKKKSPLSDSLVTTSNLWFFTTCLVPVIVFRLDGDPRCFLKLLVPLTQSAYQSTKSRSLPRLLPRASSPSPHFTPSGRSPLRCLLSLYRCLLIAASLDERGHPPGPFTPSKILQSAQPRHIFAPFWCLASPSKDLHDCGALCKCVWLANEKFGSITSR